MAIPSPEPGLVIPYAYLWHREHLSGQEESRKDRPAVIILAIAREEDAALLVTVLPMTHRPPENGSSLSKFRALSSAILALMMNHPGSSSAKATNSNGQVTIHGNFLTRIALNTASYPLDYST